MGEHTAGPGVGPALAFGIVADASDRARPSYPAEAARWLTGSTTGGVLELGAGTGKLTEQLTPLGRTVIATDPSEPMLRLLTSRAPAARALLATAENIPVSSGSVDAVVSAQAFHWFDTDRALPEIARVLRPGGVLGLVWNHRDERIPWVRRLGALVGGSDLPTDPSQTLIESRLFGFVESTTFRFWQPQTRETLRELVVSRSNVAMMTGYDRERVLRGVDELYEGYGRGADGMLLPYVTRCYRTTVRPQTGRRDGSAPADDTDALLIDFR